MNNPAKICRAFRLYTSCTDGVFYMLEQNMKLEKEVKWYIVSHCTDTLCGVMQG